MTKCFLVDKQANGLRYLRVGGRRKKNESRILFGRGKCLKTEQNPTRQVQALLAHVTTQIPSAVSLSERLVPIGCSKKSCLHSRPSKVYQ